MSSAAQLIRSFAAPLLFSPSHIYISAMALTPSSSPIKIHYSPLYRNIISCTTDGLPSCVLALRKAERAVLAVAVARDGRRLAFAVGRQVLIWDASTLQDAGQLTTPGDLVRAIVFLPDARRIISANGKNIRVWDAQTMEPVGSPVKSHDGKVLSLLCEQPGYRNSAVVSTCKILNFTAPYTNIRQ
jgi:WD40 repeat protein